MLKSIIKIRDLSFEYDDKNIFDDFNLDIYEGSFVSIVGKNASGKTTLAKLLAGIYRANGYINIDGFLLNEYFINKIRRNFSFGFNDDNTFDIVLDCLSFTLENLQYSKQEISVLIDKISKKFKIENILNKSLHEITDSERVKVQIASLLIHNPKIILLDNLLSRLSVDDKKLVIKLLKNYQKENKMTIMLLTNELEDTLISDRVIVLDDGKIILDGNLNDVYKDDALEKLGFDLPFIVRLSHNLMLYDLLDKVYFTDKEVLNKLWP